MLRSWLVGVFVLGLTAFLLCRTFIWPVGESSEGVATAKGSRENGAAQEVEFEGISIATLSAESLDPAAEVLEEPGDILSSLAAIGARGAPAAYESSSAPIEFHLDPDVPGGAAKETPEESRRKAKEFAFRAHRARSPQEIARNLTEALFTGGLGVIRKIDSEWFVVLPSGEQIELDPKPDTLEDGKTTPYVDGQDEELIAYERLLEVNRKWILDPSNDDGCFWVTENGDGALSRICERLEREGHAPVAAGLIQHVNGLRNSTIQKGHRLKVPSAPLRIVVEVNRYRLSVLIGDVLIKRFTVGLGKAGSPTPLGRFSIATKIENPTWTKPGVGDVPFGHTDNPLGTRWLGFAALIDFPNANEYGIHGTWEPSSLGGNESEGCVRMINDDVEQLFSWVSRGTSIEIRR